MKGVDKLGEREDAQLTTSSVNPPGGNLETVCMRNLLANAEERIYFKDRAGRFILASDKCIASMAPGQSPDHVLGKTDFDFFDEASAREFYDGEQQMMETGESQVGLLEVERWRDGSTTWASTTKLPLRDNDGQIIGTFGISRDVTRQVEAEHALAHQALHDSLTGLANRSLLTDRLSRALLALRREPGSVAVLFVDLDDFKDINDSAGHDAGDRVLIEVSRRLRDITRPLDTVARLGGDEFVIMCEGVDEDDLISLCRRILASLSEGISDDDMTLAVSASIGIALTQDPQTLASELVCDADAAMYQAKQLGGKQFQFLEEGRRERAAARYRLELGLRRAIDRQEFVLVYQPLFSLADNTVTSIEALIRWHHPERGVLLPADFIGAAERMGLMEEIGVWVLEGACRQLAEWISTTAKGKTLAIAVNLSARQLRQPGLVATVTETLARHRITPSQLSLEITEATLLDGSHPAPDILATLGALAALGVRVALDDFGTGFSSLAHLHRAGVDTLKIDRSLIGQLGQSERSQKLVSAVTAMAHALGLHVVAEGVETSGQLEDLASAHCDDGQGFLLAPPQSAGEIATLLG